MQSILLIGLTMVLFVAAEDGRERFTMYTGYMSPFSPGEFGFGFQPRDSLPDKLKEADKMAELENLGRPRLNAHRQAIRLAGYTCGIVGTGEIDPFELGPKFAPPLPISAKMKRRRKMKMVDTNSSSEVSMESAAMSASRSLTRSLYRYKRGLFNFKDLGEPAQLNQLCWQVKVRIDIGNGTMKVCGGTIVGSRTILTAAHCLMDRKKQRPFNPSLMTVQVGDETNDNGVPHCVEVFPVELVIPHPSYDINLEDNDVGLVLLTEHIDLVRKPCACKLCMKDKEPKVGDVCVVAGYGQASERSGTQLASLRWHKQRILRQTFDSRCAFHIGNGQLTALDDFICAGDLADDQSCSGDDGSQLLCFDEQSDSHYAAGIVSFSAGCGKHIGSQYTKVRRYLDWIEDTIPHQEVLIQRGWNREIARQL